MAKRYCDQERDTDEVPPDPDFVSFESEDRWEFVLTLGVAVALFLLGMLAGWRLAMA